KECECIAQKLSKQTESVNNEVHNKLLKSFAKLENHSISLELALQQCKEQMKNNSVRQPNAQVITVRTDRGTEFLNKTLHAYFKEEGIEHQTSTPRTPEQNDAVERRNRTHVEAARTMLLASKLPLSFWAEAAV
ncbi:retrovirus-related pol polyprotein from transposon TNT 1-94, partial [Tanacetum coccineum]